MERKLFSIIIPTFNSAATLEQTLKSVFAQTFKQFEVIVVDGVSKDHTLKICERYKDQISYSSEPDRGITDAWNKGVKRANGEWIFFLGSDDVLATNDVLQKVADEIDVKRSKLWYCRVRLTSSNGQEIKVVNQDAWNILEKKFHKISCFCHQGVFTHRSLFEDVGLFDAELKIAADFDFLLRATKTVTPIQIPHVIAANFYLGGVSNQLALQGRALREIKIALDRNGFNGSNSTLKFAWMKLGVKYVLSIFKGSSELKR